MDACIKDACIKDKYVSDESLSLCNRLYIDEKYYM